MGVYIKDMVMPGSCYQCNMCVNVLYGEDIVVICTALEKEITALMVERQDDCPLIEVATPHGRLIDADALAADLKRQCKEVFKTDTVSPDDFWITRNQAYNERLWTTWCESLFDYFKAAPTIVEAEEA